MTDRLVGISDKYGDVLLSTIRRLEPSRPEGFLPAPDVIMLFADHDPTPHKSATQWLVITYIRGGLTLDDLSSAEDTLRNFYRVRTSLPPDQQDINQHMTLSAVWSAVVDYMAKDVLNLSRTRSWSDVQSEDELRARDESEVVHEGPDGFMVVRPMTEFAAKWWGRGTDWKISAEADNEFEERATKGQITIFVMPGKWKLEMFVGAHDACISDHQGMPLHPGLSTIAKVWPFISEFVLEAAAVNGFIASYIPHDAFDAELCERLFLADVSTVAHFPDRLIKREHCLALAKASKDYLFYYIPDRHKDYEVCLAAVECWGGFLSGVPMEFRDERMCRAAVRKSGFAIQDVPPHVMNRDLCLLAVNSYRDVLSCIPAEFVDEEIILAFLDDNERGLLKVPDRYLTRRIIEAILRKRPMDLEFLPENKRDRALCEIAVAAAPRAIRYVPRSVVDDALCQLAVNKRAWSLCFIPEAYRTVDLCAYAVSMDRDARRYVPEAVFAEVEARSARTRRASTYVETPFGSADEDYDFSDAGPWDSPNPTLNGTFAIEGLRPDDVDDIFADFSFGVDDTAFDGDFDFSDDTGPSGETAEEFDTVPMRLTAEELAFLRPNGVPVGEPASSNPLDIPREELTRGICLDMVREDGKALKFVPDEWRDREMCIAAVLSNGSALAHIPPVRRDVVMCVTAVMNDGFAMKHVPDALATRDLCEHAVRQSYHALQFVPERHKDRDMCILAIENSGFALSYIPDVLLDIDLCRMAMAAAPHAYAYVPAAIRARFTSEERARCEKAEADYHRRLTNRV